MNRAPKIGLLLFNLGTPSSPEVPDVRRYPAPNASAAWAKALVEIAGERLLAADRGS